MICVFVFSQLWVVIGKQKEIFRKCFKNKTHSKTILCKVRYFFGQLVEIMNSKSEIRRIYYFIVDVNTHCFMMYVIDSFYLRKFLKFFLVYSMRLKRTVESVILLCYCLLLSYCCIVFNVLNNYRNIWPSVHFLLLYSRFHKKHNYLRIHYRGGGWFCSYFQGKQHPNIHDLV